MDEKNRQRQRQLAKLLNQSQDVTQVYQLKELLTILIDDCKDKLTSCPVEVFRNYQGEVQAYKTLLNLIEKSNDYRD